MLFVSASMPKAGSAWWLGMQTALLRRAGWDDPREIRQGYGLDDLLRSRNCTLSSLEAPSLERLRPALEAGRHLIVKSHAFPTHGLVAWRAEDRVAYSYICRDPRDAILSALEHGAALRAAGLGDRPFAHLRTLGDALLEWGTVWMPTAEAWHLMPGVIRIRYEDLVEDPVRELGRFASALGLATGTDDLTAAAAALSPERVRADGTTARKMHFNQGRIGRHREVFSRREQEVSVQILGPWLDLWGYDRAISPGNLPGTAAHLGSPQAAYRLPEAAPPSP